MVQARKQGKAKKIIKIGLAAANSDRGRKNRILADKKPEVRERRRRAAVARMARVPVVSKLNDRFKEALRVVGLFPESEFTIGYYTVDFCFVEERVVVEVDGDYWHCNPDIYEKPKNTIQRRVVGKDRAEKRYLENGGWILLRFWESEIKDDLEKCIKRVMGALSERRG